MSAKCQKRTFHLGAEGTNAILFWDRALLAPEPCGTGNQNFADKTAP